MARNGTVSIAQALAVALAIAVPIVLTGCAVTPPAPLPADLLWQDQAFDYDAALVSVSKRDLFQLDPGLLSKLHDAGVQNSSVGHRLHHLVSLLFGP